MHTLEGHTGPITDVHHNWDTIISSCVYDKTVKFWKKRSGECLFTLNCDVPVACLAMNLTEPSTHIYFGHTNGIVAQWDMETQQEVQRMKVTNRSVEGIQIFDNQCIASDFSQIFVKSFEGGMFYIIHFIIFWY